MAWWGIETGRSAFEDVAAGRGVIPLSIIRCLFSRISPVELAIHRRGTTNAASNLACRGSI